MGSGRTRKVALTIAGSDPVSGAGIQADLKTFAAFGVYGLSVVTALTAQNTAAVADVLPVPPEFVRLQLRHLRSDAHPDVVKVGMLADVHIASAVAEELAGAPRIPLVVDPVLKATAAGSGTLLAPEAVSTLVSSLLPLATVVTPNRDEASVLSGMAVDSLDAAREAARRIAGLGAGAVVVKGGHLDGPSAVDILFHDGTVTEFKGPRYEAGTLHGTGCTFASAIAAALALGRDVPTAVGEAKRYTAGAIRCALWVGTGARVLDHFWEQPEGRGLYS